MSSRTSVSSQLGSILFKILALFMIVMVPVYVLGMTIYLWGYREMHNQVVSSALSQVTLYAMTLNAEIERIQNLQFECINDDDILYLANVYKILDNFERAQYMLRVQRRLQIVRSSSECIESIVLHLPRIDKTITPDRVGPLDPDWENVVTNLKSASRSGIVYGSDGNMFMNIQYPVIPREGRQPILVMEIMLSNRNIQEILKGFGLADDSELFFANIAYNFALSDKRTGELPIEFITAVEERPSGTKSVLYQGKQTEITYVYSQKLDTYFISAAPTSNVFAITQQYRFIFIGFTLISIMLMVAFAYFIRSWVHNPVRKLVNAFKELRTGNFHTSIAHQRHDEFGYLYQSFNKTMANLNDLIQQVYTQKINAQRAELKQLQSQINPHFLYNSFYNIYRMAMVDDTKSIAAFANYLGQYYQYITRNSADEVTMAQEIEHAKIYLNIQGMRYNRKVSIQVGDNPLSFTSYNVPRLIIQPLIENAFEHGLQDVEKPSISMQFFEDSQSYGVIVEDNGTGMEPAVLQQLEIKMDDMDAKIETSALINTHRRLKYRFGDQSGLSFSSGPEKGFQVRLTIIKRRDDHVSAADS